jgi:hypothetical protein
VVKNMWRILRKLIAHLVNRDKHRFNCMLDIASFIISRREKKLE